MQQRDATPPARSEATHPTRGVFRLEGEYWTLGYGGTTCRLHDAAGMRHLARLLARPGQKVAATALIRPARCRGETRPRGRAGEGSATAAATERGRVRVTRAVRAAMARIARHHAPLAEHLAATIKTGAYCSYAPDRRIAPTWQL